jgi:hypothetical protein
MTTPAGPSRRSNAPLSEYTFDGSNWEDLTRLITLAKLHRASQTEVDSDTTQSTWCARQFTGPALDWVGLILIVDKPLLDNFDKFITKLNDHFGITATLISTHQRVQLEALKWRRDAPTFFAEFSRLATECGLGGENAGKLTLLMSKVPDAQKTILARQTPPPTTYAETRARLLSIWANDPHSTGVQIEKSQTKPKCGKCGKKGHTASDCRTPAKAEK